MEDFPVYVFSRFFHVFHSATNSTIKIRNNKTRTKQWQQKNSCINSFHCSALTAFFVSLSFSLTQMVFATAAFILILYSFKFFRPLEIGYVFMFSCERCFCVALCLLFQMSTFFHVLHFLPRAFFFVCACVFFVYSSLCTVVISLYYYMYLYILVHIYLMVESFFWNSFGIRFGAGMKAFAVANSAENKQSFCKWWKTQWMSFWVKLFFVCRCSVICKFVLRCLMQPSIVQYSSVHANPGDINSRHIIRKISAQRQPHISNRSKHLSVASLLHLVFFVFLRFAVCDVFDDNSADDDNDNGRERWFRVNRNVIKLFHSFFRSLSVCKLHLQSEFLKFDCDGWEKATFFLVRASKHWSINLKWKFW